MTEPIPNGGGTPSAPLRPRPPRVPGFRPARRLPYVANVSWPRSGHVLLARILTETFEGWFGYCEYYTPSKVENSPCCGAFPCRRTDIVSMSKQHDFKFDAELPDDHLLIVQYRAFLPSLVSHWDQRAATSPGLVDSAEEFRRFARHKAEDYERFLERWVRRPRTNRLLLPYEAFTAEPSRKMRQVLDLFDAADCAGRMEEVIATIDGLTFADGGEKKLAGAGIADRRDITQFRYYDAAFFAELGETTDTDVTT